MGSTEDTYSNRVYTTTIVDEYNNDSNNSNDAHNNEYVNSDSKEESEVFLVAKLKLIPKIVWKVLSEYDYLCKNLSGDLSSE